MARNDVKFYGTVYLFQFSKHFENLEADGFAWGGREISA
jgi:hypothetical protein